METRTAQHEEKESKGDWKSVAMGFAGNMLELLSANVSAEIHRKFRAFKKRSMGTAIMFVGLVFFLVSVALIINMLTQDMYPWIGYLIVGLATLAIGHVMTKE